MKPMECKLNWVILRNVESNETKIQSQNRRIATLPARSCLAIWIKRLLSKLGLHNTALREYQLSAWGKTMQNLPASTAAMLNNLVLSNSTGFHCRFHSSLTHHSRPQSHTAETRIKRLRCPCPAECFFPLDMCNADSNDGYVVLVRMTARALNVMAAFFWNL